MGNSTSVNTRNKFAYPNITLAAGSIGVGKSTLIGDFSKVNNVNTYDEDMDLDTLSIFYSDIKQLSALFQANVFNVQLNKYNQIHLNAAVEIIEALKRGAAGLYKVNEFNILDRGIYGNIIFTYMLYKRGIITLKQILLIKDIIWSKFSTFETQTNIVYLYAKPEIAYYRCKQRARGSLSGIALEYLNDLDRAHFLVLFDLVNKQSRFTNAIIPWDGDKISYNGRLIKRPNVYVIDWTLFKDANYVINTCNDLQACTTMDYNDSYYLSKTVSSLFKPYCVSWRDQIVTGSPRFHYKLSKMCAYFDNNPTNDWNWMNDLDLNYDS